MGRLLSRRQLMLGGVMAAVSSGCVTKPASTGQAGQAPPPIDAQITAAARRHGATVGVFAVDLNSGRSVMYRADERFALCSTFKVYAAARVLQLVQDGELQLDRTVRVDPASVVANSPRTQPRAGQQMAIGELCRAALQVSDNTAGNLLLEIIGGPSAITDFARSIGDQRSRLDRWETELNAAVPGESLDTSTPEALGRGCRALLVGDVLAPPQRQLLGDWMRANETSSLRAALPPGWTIADKTGGGGYGSTNDVGVADGPQGQRLVLALMARSQSGDPHAAGLRPLIGELATLLLPVLLDSN